MNARCPACGKQYPYAFADFGCSAACRYDWTTGREVTPPAPALFVGDRVRIHEPWSPFHNKLAPIVQGVAHEPFVHVFVTIGEDPRPTIMPARACEVLP
jgi:hypothetical protein